jgi:hypothetical protein
MGPFHGKNTYNKRKRKKNGTGQHDEDQQQMEKGLTIGHLECTITVQTRGLRTINEIRKYKIAIAAIQETRWDKFTPQAFTSNGYNIYTSMNLIIIIIIMNLDFLNLNFLVDSKFNHMVKNRWINNRATLCTAPNLRKIQ